MIAAEPARPPLPFGIAAPAWLVAWVGGMGVAGAAVLVAIGADFDELRLGDVVASTTVGWLVVVAVLWWAARWASRSSRAADVGPRRFTGTYAAAFRPVDLIGIPIGVAGQLVLVPLLYVPLRQLWPTTFSDERLERTARELADKADGSWSKVALLALVVIGAPLVEELVYRGMLQRSLAPRLGPWAALAVASVWFALIHLQPILYPGLALAGALFGLGLVMTGRIGMGIMAHAAFNAVGIATVLTS